MQKPVVQLNSYLPSLLFQEYAKSTQTWRIVEG